MDNIFYELAAADGLASGIKRPFRGDAGKLFRDAGTASKYYEGEKEGLLSETGDVLIPALFVQVECCRNFLYLLTETYIWRIYPQGGVNGVKIYEDDPEGRLFAKEGKVGWLIGDKTIVEPLYDEVYKWYKADVYFTQRGDVVKYFNGFGTQILSDVTKEVHLAAQESDDVVVMSLADEFVGQDIVLQNDLPARLRTETATEILERFTKTTGQLVLPIKPESLELFKSAFAYEFSAFEAESNSETPLRDCLEQFTKLPVFTNSWHYLINIRIASDQCLNVEDLRYFRRFFEDTDREGTCLISGPILSLGVNITIDPSLTKGTVKVFLAEFFTDHWPSGYEDAWEKVCSEESCENLMSALRNILEELHREEDTDVADSLHWEMQRYAYYDVRYSTKRTWRETEKVLALLKRAFTPFDDRALFDMVNDLVSDIEYGYGNISAKERDFLLRKARWLLENGANPNTVKEGKTPLDMVLPHRGNARIDKLCSFLTKYGAKTKEDLRREEDMETEVSQELARW